MFFEGPGKAGTFFMCYSLIERVCTNYLKMNEMNGCNIHTTY